MVDIAPDGPVHDGPRPRIVCVGANEESLISLRGLIDHQASVVGLVTLDPSRRDDLSDYVDLAPVAAEHGLACVRTVDINDAATIHALRALEPDFVFTLGWSQLMSDEVLAIPSGYVVGSHPSLLPAGRGRAPVPWTIILGERRGAVSLFRMVRGADAGPLLIQRPFDVPAGIDAGALYRLVSETMRDAYRDLYSALASGQVTETPQSEADATYRAGRVPADGHVDFGRPREEIDRLVRAVSRPFPGAYAYLRAEPVHIWRSDLSDVPAYVGTPGQVLAKRAGRLLVQAGDGPLWLSDLTVDGAPVDDDHIRIGDRFGFRIEDELFRLRQEVAHLKARVQDP